MRIRTPAAAIAAVAMAALPISQASAQSCVNEQEAAQLAIYAVPSWLDGVSSVCQRTAGLAAADLKAVRGRYAALQDQTWPSAKSAALKLVAGSGQAGGFVGTLAQIPDRNARPLVDALIAQRAAEGIKPADCATIARGIAVVQRIAPRDAGALLGFVLTVARPKGINICQAPR